MLNVRLLIEAAHQAYRAEMRKPPKRRSPRSLGLGRSVLGHGFCVKDAGADEVTAQVDQTDWPFRRGELLSTLSQLKQWKVRMWELDRGKLPDTSVIGA
jgi:hypothetical protein